MKLYFSEAGAGITTGTVFQLGLAAGMWIENERDHKSRYADVSHVIEFNGYGSRTYKSNRRPNERQRSGYYAATWDQWGLLLSALFERDPAMKVGGYKHPYYDGVGTFNFRTDYRFDGLTTMDELIEADLWHGDHTFKFSGLVGTQQCTRCSAIQRWQ